MELATKTSTSNQLSMPFLYDFHTLMDDNDIIMIYEGDFSQEFIKTVLSFTELKFNADDLENNTKRKIFNVMVECLQNISKHQFSNQEADPRMASIFMIGYTNEDYLIISSNPIYNNKIEGLKTLLDKVNSLDKDGLKQLYKKVRMENRFSEVGGAGIGIIDMARKSGRKLEFNFHEFDEDISIYDLLVKIPRI